MRIDLERLSRDRLDQLSRILEEVLDLDSEAIPPVLDRLCADDRELLAQVGALLDADRGSRNFLTRPAMDWIPGLVRDLARLQGISSTR